MFCYNDCYIICLCALIKEATSPHLMNTEYMCFNQKGDISTRNDSSLKLIHLPRKQWIFSRGRHHLVTRKSMDHNRLAIGLMEVRPDRSNKTQFFFQEAVLSILLCGCTTLMLTKRMEKKLMVNTQECYKQVMEATSDKAVAVRPPNTHHENYPS